ncbi:lytic transglycosylase domain-containing protein [Sphingobium sp. EP60837]|uniref:lytic transglycosylase domain-containing protein n=1 Tax=Sphingobium sp. EP60837 TaxID=1855519 RepID=UPI0007DCE7A1|nr:lytic transglycosylase domain-containing protein [Sphingobium sp. EP60837]ANI80391.1 Type IV secretion system protein virB1 [Sphingobium sp. EP60837]
MILELVTVVGLAQQCAPSVAVETLVSVVHTESHFNPYAIGVNAKGVAAPNPGDRVSAAAVARSLIARGYNIDLGLGQINSANLRWLGLSVEDAFDPCRNLAAAARVLASNYLSVARSSPSTEAAIATALSMYNTGSRSRGFRNGYVGRVYASSSVVLPAIRRGAMPEPAASPTAVTPEPKFTQPPAGVRSPRVQNGWDTTAGAQTASLMVFGGAPDSSPKGQAE